MKTSTLLVITTCILAVIASVIAGWLGRGVWDARHSEQPQSDTVYVWKRDTIRLVKEVPVAKVVERLKIVRDTIEHSDSILVPSPSDSATVEIPITRRTYEGENYKAVVQGFRPELVSIDIRQQTVTLTEVKRKRWNVTVGPQIGYGITPAGWQPYAGVGATFGFSF